MLKKVKFKIDQETVEDSMFCGYVENNSDYRSNCLVAVLLKKHLNIKNVKVTYQGIYINGAVTQQSEEFYELIQDFDRMNPTQRYKNLIGREIEIILDDELLKNSDIGLEECEEWEEDEEEYEEEIIEELLH